MLRATHAACRPARPQPLQPRGRGDGRGPGCPVPALAGCPVVPMGRSASLLPTARAPPPLPLPSSACCMKGALDLNLSARIRVRSRSPLPSTEPHQGCEAASAMAGYSRGGSARAAAVAGRRGTRRWEGAMLAARCWGHHSWLQPGRGTVPRSSGCLRGGDQTERVKR